MTAQDHDTDPQPQPAAENTGRAKARRRRVAGIAVFAAAAAFTAAVAVVDLTGGTPQHPAPHRTSATPVAVGAPMPASVPDRIEIPSIGVDAALRSVGLQPNGEMEPPSFNTPMEAAWYRHGPTPGAAGAAAIVGHLDTPTTPEAVFYRLDELKQGAVVDVEREDHTTAVFTVDAVRTFPKSAFPDEEVYGDTGGKAELRVITCGGDLTPERHWDSNVVVFAHLTGRA